MTVVYALALTIGLAGLLYYVLAGALADNMSRPHLDPSVRFGARGRAIVGAVAGFGAAGMAAEFAPLGLASGVVGLLALLGAVASGWWAWHGDGGSSQAS